MALGGWGPQPWGPSSWGGSGGPCNGGWGVQTWGSSLWGGCIPTPPIPIQPPQIGDFERIYREQRWKHEPQIVRNVLFKVEGVSAKLHLGRPTCSTGYGTRARLRHALQLHSGVGAVGIETGTGTWAAVAAARSACECGEVEAGVSVRCEMSEGVTANTDVGVTKVRAIKNPTDEEFLMMIAEML